jgi:hypothetical protein
LTPIDQKRAKTKKIKSHNKQGIWQHKHTGKQAESCKGEGF